MAQAKTIHLMRFVQVVGTLTLGVVLARSVDWAEFQESIVQLHWPYLALAALLMLASHMLNIVRWRLTLQVHSVSYATLSAYYGAGLFSNNFLPTGVGGDGVRVALATRHTTLSRAALSVILDRGIGLVGLCSFVLPGLWLGVPEGMRRLLVLPQLPASWLWPTLLLCAMLSIGVPVGRQLLLRWSAAFARLHHRADAPRQTGRNVWGWIVLFLGAYLLSLGSSAALTAAVWAVLTALQAGVGAGPAIWTTVVSSLSLLLPISVNGLGVFEGAFVLTLGSHGVATSTALAAALIMRSLGILFSLLGGLVSLCESWPTRELHPDQATPGVERPL